MEEVLTRKVLNEELASFFGDINRQFDMRFNTIERTQRAKFDRIYLQLDNIAKRLNVDLEERIAMGYQIDRHQNWITQLADQTKNKLVPEA